MSWNQKEERGIQVEGLLGVACLFLAPVRAYRYQERTKSAGRRARAKS